MSRPLFTLLAALAAATCATAARAGGGEDWGRMEIHSPRVGPIQQLLADYHGTDPEGQKKLPQFLAKLGYGAQFPEATRWALEGLRSCEKPESSRKASCSVPRTGPLTSDDALLPVGAILMCVRLERDEAGHLRVPMALRRCAKARSLALARARDAFKICQGGPPDCRTDAEVDMTFGFAAGDSLFKGTTADWVRDPDQYNEHTVLEPPGADGEIVRVLARWAREGFGVPKPKKPRQKGPSK